MEVAENLNKLDQALFEGLVTRDPLGFMMVGPPDALEQHGHFSEHMFREFATFLVEKYDSVVIDGGRGGFRRAGAGGQPGLGGHLPGHRRRSSPPSATRSATSAS